MNIPKRFEQATANALSLDRRSPNIPLLPEHLKHSGLSLDQLLMIARAHWRLSAAIIVGIVLVCAIAIKFIPKTYVSQATLIVNSETKDVLAGRDFPVEMLSSYVATQTELMMSSVILLPVVDRLNLTTDKNFSRGFSGGTKDALREYIAKNLSLNIQIETGRGGQLLYVSASGKNPQIAADLSNTVADVYIEQDRRRANGPASERAVRYSEELAELRDKVTAGQDKVTAFRKENGLGDIGVTTNDTETQTLDTLQQKLLETQNLRRTLEAKGTGNVGSANEAMTSASIQQLKLQLRTQTAQLADMQATHGPQHPKVKELQGQIETTRQALASETGSLSDNTNTELLRTQQLQYKYERAVADQQDRVLKLRQLHDAGSKLTLELESAQSVYKHALEGYDQIMFAAGANHTNVSFVSRAVPPLKASKPNKPKLLLMSLVAALGIGLAGPTLYEILFHRRVRSRDDIERDFGITVLAQFESEPSLVAQS